MSEEVSPFALDLDIEPESPKTRNRPSFRHAFLVLAGGFLGTLLRYALLLHHPSAPTQIGWMVLWINCSGAFVLGVLGASLFRRRSDLIATRLFLVTGVLGGWTTYSAVISGALTMSHNSAHKAAAATLLLELIVPVLFAGIGLLLGSVLRKSAS